MEHPAKSNIGYVTKLNPQPMVLLAMFKVPNKSFGMGFNR